MLSAVLFEHFFENLLRVRVVQLRVLVRGLRCSRFERGRVDGLQRQDEMFVNEELQRVERRVNVVDQPVSVRVHAVDGVDADGCHAEVVGEVPFEMSGSQVEMDLVSPANVELVERVQYLRVEFEHVGEIAADGVVNRVVFENDPIEFVGRFHQQVDVDLVLLLESVDRVREPADDLSQLVLLKI